LTEAKGILWLGRSNRIAYEPILSSFARFASMSVPQWLHQLQRSLFSSKGLKLRNAGRCSSRHRRASLCLEALEDRLAPSADLVTVAAGNLTTSFSESQQNVTLTASVKDATNSSTTVNEGSVSFIVKDKNGNQVGSTVQGAVSNGSASASFALPASEAAGNYTIDVSYSDPPNNFTDNGTDTPGALTVRAASTTTTASNTTATFSESNQPVELTATVTSSAGIVNEGSVTFTVVDGSGNTIGTAISGNVSNGSARVSYVLPGGTAAGSYTIQAAYSDSAGNFTASSDNTHSLTVNAANATTVSLTSVHLVPNVSNGTAQVTLTAQVSNPNGTVNEGIVSFTVAGVSGQGKVSNGTATVQLTVPLSDVTFDLIVDLSYTDNAPSADFGASSTSVLVSTSVWNALLPANVTVYSSNGQQVQFSLGNLPLFSALYSASTGLLSQINLGSLAVPVTYTNLGSLTVASVEGVAWGLIFYDSNGQLQGIADVEHAPDGSLEWVFYDSNHKPIGTSPYPE
jgi:hypothetical protein